MTQHTPGPWKWWTSNSWRRLRHNVDGGRRTVSVLEPYVCRDGHPDCSVSDADARLIAAAPDMLAALQAAKEVIEGHFDDNCEECMIAHGAVCAAIAKATGAKP